MKVTRLVPVVHLGCSLALYTAAHLMPSGPVGYGAALVFFLVNLPGVFIINFFYKANAMPTSLEKTMVITADMLITATLLFALLWLLGKMLRHKPF